MSEIVTMAERCWVYKLWIIGSTGQLLRAADFTLGHIQLSYNSVVSRIYRLHLGRCISGGFRQGSVGRRYCYVDGLYRYMRMQTV